MVCGPLRVVDWRQYQVARWWPLWVVPWRVYKPRDKVTAKEPPTTATSERLGIASSRPLLVGHRPLNSRCPGAYPVDVGESFPPNVAVFVLATPAVYFQSKPERTPLSRKPPTQKTPAVVPCSALLSHYALDDNNIFVCQQSLTINTAASTIELHRR